MLTKLFCQLSQRQFLRPQCFLSKDLLFNRLYSNDSQSKQQNDDPQPQLPPKKRLSLSNGIERLLLRSRLVEDNDIAHFLARSATFSIYGMISIATLGTLGIDTSPFLAGIGITGFTLGFALKEIATNFLCGVLLVLAKPFKKGQHIRVMIGGNEGKMEGDVVSIDAKYVLLRTKQGGRGKDEEATLLVPSVMVYTNPIVVTEKK